nr:RNA-directed DNA polymerase, eukaryota, reverse transcriptase zinc-binding domain protein [Tanacetum cinerariifolium]
DTNPIRTLGDYSKPSHEGYRNTIELPIGNNVVPLRPDTIRLVQNGCSFHGLRDENVSIKKRYQDLYQSKAESNSNVSSGATVHEKPKVLALGLYVMMPKYVPPQKRNNREANTPLPRKEAVSLVKKTNMCVNLSTGIKSVTEASKSKSNCEMKTHRNLPARSEKVKRVDNPLRNLNKRNRVDSSLSVKRTSFILKTVSVCKTFFGVFVTKLATNRLVNSSFCKGINMVVKDLDLEPKDIVTEFCGSSRWKELSKETSSKILPCDGVGSKRYHIAPYGEFNGIPIALVARLQRRDKSVVVYAMDQLIKFIEEKIEADSANINDFDSRIRFLQEVDRLDTFESFDLFQNMCVKLDIKGGRLSTCMNKARTNLSKLDRFLISEEVAEALLDVRVTSIDRLWPVHNPILPHVSKFTPFKLYHSWLLRDSFDEVIKIDLPKLEEHNFERKLLSYEKFCFLKARIKQWHSKTKTFDCVTKHDNLKLIKFIEEKIEADSTNINEFDSRIRFLEEVDRLDTFESFDLFQNMCVKLDIKG